MSEIERVASASDGRGVAASRLTVEFCGEEYALDPGARFGIGRDADLTVDRDNGYLHRRLVELSFEEGFWWIANVGSRLSVTVSGEAGTLHSWIGPGSRIPVVLSTMVVLFTAGDTTYEISLECESASFVATGTSVAGGDVTLGAVDLTASQLRLILALAEPTLRRAGSGTSDLPTNVAAARRLGWSMTTFNRKLDNVCDKFSRGGVKGLRGEPGRLATNRRARLVEYAVAAKIVRPELLSLLDDAVEASR